MTPRKSVDDSAKANLKSKKKGNHVRRCAIFLSKSSKEQKKTLHPESFVHLASATPFGYAPEHPKKKLGHLPLKKDLVAPLGTTKHGRAYIVSRYELKRVIYRVLHKRIWQSGKF